MSDYEFLESKIRQNMYQNPDAVLECLDAVKRIASENARLRDALKAIAGSGNPACEYCSSHERIVRAAAREETSKLRAELAEHRDEKWCFNEEHVGWRNLSLQLAAANERAENLEMARDVAQNAALKWERKAFDRLRELSELRGAAKHG